MNHALVSLPRRYLLMLSFNNSLDVVRHLPYLFHIVTFIVCTGPISMRASTHGLVINIIHSLCTCSKPSGETGAEGKKPALSGQKRKKEKGNRNVVRRRVISG